MGWMTTGLEFVTQYDQGFSLLHIVQTRSGANPVSYPVGTKVLSLGINWLRHEVDHSPPTSA
jgi:hypothetical protein